jgi:hypothetical protein
VPAARLLLSRTAAALIEGAVFGYVPGIGLRPLVTRMFRSHLVAIEPQFDAAFYAGQFTDRRRRAGVERAPLLHYVLVGWHEHRSPSAGFDPVFYRRDNLDLRPSSDPLLHYVVVGAARSAPRNEVDRDPAHLRWRDDRETVLTIHHGRGGGSSRFLDLLESDIWREGRNVLRMRAVAGSPDLTVIDDRGAVSRPDVPAKPFNLADDSSQLTEFAQSRRVVRLLVNHLIDRPPAMIDWVRNLSAGLRCPYDVVLHDYFALCPRVDMITGEGVSCDAAPPDACVRCVTEYGSEVHGLDPYAWRSDFLAFLAGAARVIVPSEDLAARMRRHLVRQFDVWPPEDDRDLPDERAPCLGQNDPLRIAVLGALNVPKGARVVQALARASASVGSPLELSILGPSSETDSLERVGVHVSGPYRPEAIDELIDAARPHVVFLPAIWPETWSFVMSVAMKRGLPVVAFDIGAPAERLRRLGRGHILPLELSTEPARLLSAFLALREQWLQ